MLLLNYLHRSILTNETFLLEPLWLFPGIFCELIQFEVTRNAFVVENILFISISIEVCG